MISSNSFSYGLCLLIYYCNQLHTWNPFKGSLLESHQINKLCPINSMSYCGNSFGKYFALNFSKIHLDHSDVFLSIRGSFEGSFGYQSTQLGLFNITGWACQCEVWFKTTSTALGEGLAHRLWFWSLGHLLENILHLNRFKSIF